MTETTDKKKQTPERERLKETTEKRKKETTE